MILFYSTNIEMSTIILSNEEHIHCSKVLRKQVNEEIYITDGKGNIFTCIIAEIAKTNTKCRILSILETPKPTNYLAIGITPTKNPSRLEWFVEKAVEIGISEILILNTQRTERKSMKFERLDRIIISAMKQSLNVYLPEISIVSDFKNINTYCSHFENKFIAYCDGPADVLSLIYNKKNSVIVLIGPEGDFTSEEIETAKQHHFTPVSLGNTRLRTETAGLVALMMLKW